MKINPSIILLFFILPLFLFSQNKIEHEVKQKETLYSISKKYDLSIEELKEMNPILETEGLQPNQILLIKKEKIKNISPKNKPKKSSKNKNYVFIEPKQTLYSITKQYNLTEEELIKLNPSIKNGLKIGDSILINPIKQIKSNESDRHKYENIHLVLMLPFTLRENKESLQKLSKEFLLGARFALDSLARQGKKIHLKVFDTKNDEAEINNFLKSYDFSTVDAIIGPMFKSQLELVAKSVDPSILLVSPISTAESLLEYSNMIISEPSFENEADKILDEITKDYTGEPLYILTTEREIDMANYAKEKFLDKYPDAEVKIGYTSSFFPTGDELISLSEKPTAFITLLASQEATLSEDYLNYLQESLLQKDIKNVKNYAIGYIPLYDKKIKTLKAIGFTYSMTHRVNIYGLDEKILIGKFKKNYCQEPSKYMGLGFDIVFDIVDRMNDKGKLWNNLEGSFTRFSTKFDYEKIKKAHVNKGIRLIKLFEIKTEKPNE